MHLRIYIVILIALFAEGCEPEGGKTFAQEPPSHSALTELLQEFVTKDGLVDYQGLQTDSLRLNAYLETLSNSHPSQNWTSNEQLAYWINAYNAFTLRLIIRNYPLESIKDVTFVNIPMVHSPWDLDFIRIQGEEYDLNDIEHGIIRKQFEVPEIHFALVCAARSCPQLRREAYEPDRLDNQLNEQARVFLLDPRKNQITEDEVHLSKLFLWYKGDFTQKGSLLDFIRRKSGVHISSEAKVDYLKYDWSLNEQK